MTQNSTLPFFSALMSSLYLHTYIPFFNAYTSTLDTVDIYEVTDAWNNIIAEYTQKYAKIFPF